MGLAVLVLYALLALVVCVITVLIVASVAFANHYTGTVNARIPSPLDALYTIALDHKRVPVSTQATDVRNVEGQQNQWQESLDDGATVILVTETSHGKPTAASPCHIHRSMLDKIVGMTADWKLTLTPGEPGVTEVEVSIAVDVSKCRGLFKPFMRVVFTLLGGTTTGITRYCNALAKAATGKDD